MKKQNLIKAGIVVLCLGMTAGCSGGEETKDLSEQTEPNIVKAETKTINEVHLRDVDLLYQNEDDTSVITMYLTVSRGNNAENTNHSWEEINTYSVYDYNEMGVERYQAAALLQVGDESGPQPGKLGYDTEIPNATVQVRGQTSTRYPRKSYKIKIKDNKGTWNNQKTINLNKHQQDGMRFRNKLMYKLIQGIPQMIGLRTQFVHLYVRDDTGPEPGQFEDYGLYTQVEQLNKSGLRAHGLDENGHLYKINFFGFYRYEDAIKLEDDPDFDRTQFEKLMEIKGSSDHTKLIAMLDDLNNYAIPAEDILDRYFDRENLTYWLAFHILTGNVDTQSRNTFLYSPLNSDTWYLISWDNDSALCGTEDAVDGFVDMGSWESGISNYWGNVLFRRCLQSPAFLAEVDTAIHEMKEYLSAERIKELAEKYAAVVRPYLYSMPDRMDARLSEEEYDQVLQALSEEVEKYYQLYLNGLEKPMPFYIDAPQIQDGILNIIWETAFDFDGENITYTAEVSNDYTFSQVLYKSEEMIMPELSMAAPAPGQYFVRVRAKNESGYEQDAFDYYVTDSGKQFGMMCFYIMPGGIIEEDIYEE